MLSLLDTLYKEERFEDVIQKAPACLYDTELTDIDVVACLFLWCNSLMYTIQWKEAKELILLEISPRVSEPEMCFPLRVMLCECRIMLDEKQTPEFVCHVEDVVREAMALGPGTGVYWTAARIRSQMYVNYNMEQVAVEWTETLLDIAKEHAEVFVYCQMVEFCGKYYQTQKQFAKAMHYYRILKENEEAKVEDYAKLCMQLFAPQMAVDFIKTDCAPLAAARRAVVDEEFARAFVEGKDRVCAQCFSVGKGYNKCPCFMVHYCSTKCQLEAWPAHSLTCTREKERLCVVCHEGGCQTACRCKCILYCSKECQLRDWPSHKHVCAIWEKNPS